MKHLADLAAARMFTVTKSVEPWGMFGKHSV